MDQYGLILLAALGLVILVGALGFLWERRARGPMLLLDSDQHRRAITNSRYFRDVHDSTTTG